MTETILLSKNPRQAASLFLFFCFISCVAAFAPKSVDSNMVQTRRGAIQTAAAVAASLLVGAQTVNAFSVSSGDDLSKQFVQLPQSVNDAVNGLTKPTVAYRPLSLDIPEFGVSVPVAMWFPAEESKPNAVVKKVEYPKSGMFGKSQSELKYNHRISVKKIGQLLAGWDFIPDFAAKDFQLRPTIDTVEDGTKMPMPTSGPVVFLAHGYLGSRFDLSHLAEALAQEGTSLVYYYAQSKIITF